MRLICCASLPSFVSPLTLPSPGDGVTRCQHTACIPRVLEHAGASAATKVLETRLSYILSKYVFFGVSTVSLTPTVYALSLRARRLLVV